MVSLAVNELIKWGVTASLLVFAVLVVLAYQGQRRAQNRLKLVSEKLHRLGGLVEAMGEEKRLLEKQAKEKVERQALQMVLEQTADALVKALTPQQQPVRAVARSRGVN